MLPFSMWKLIDPERVHDLDRDQEVKTSKTRSQRHEEDSLRPLFIKHAFEEQQDVVDRMTNRASTADRHHSAHRLTTSDPLVRVPWHGPAIVSEHDPTLPRRPVEYDRVVLAGGAAHLDEHQVEI